MLDGFPKVNLFLEVSITRVAQENLELPLPPDSLDSHQAEEQ